MLKKYSITKTESIAEIRFFVKPELNDIIKAIKDVHENYTSHLRLWDVSTSGFDLTNDQLRELAEKSKDLPHSKVAIVASEDLSFGNARMLEVFRDDEDTDHMVFRSIQEARTWLKK